MAVIPYLSQGQGVPIDAFTGMPKKKKQAAGPRAWGPGGPGWQQTQGFGNTLAGGADTQRPGAITLSGFTPDYAALIKQALSPLSAQLGAEGVADAGSRDNQLIRTLGQFGEQFDSAGAQQAFGQDFYQQAGLEGLLPRANQLAQQTTDAGMSFTARAKQGHQKAVQQIQDALAARGLLRSGATGVALQDQQRQFDTGQYDARAQMQDFLSSINQGYLQTQRQRQAQLDAAGREEAGRQAQLNPATGTQQAAFHSYTPDGTPVFKRADGQLVLEDGTVYTPTVAAPPQRPTPAVRGIGSRQYQAM